MSYTKAWALAREVPDSELRPKLIAAYESLIEVAAVIPYSDGPLDDNLSGAVDAEVTERKDACEEAERRADEAESRLEAYLQKQSGGDSQVASLIAERDALSARLAAVEPLVVAYSDSLAAARRFVSSAEGAGVPVKHVRRAPGRQVRHGS